MNQLKVWLLSCRGIMSGNVLKNPISRITSNRHLIRFALFAATGLGIAAWAGYYNGLEARIAIILQKVSVIVFLFVTAMLAIQAGFQVHAERTAPGKPFSPFDLLIVGGLTRHLPRRTRGVLRNVHLLCDRRSLAHPRDLRHLDDVQQQR